MEWDTLGNLIRGPYEKHLRDIILNMFRRPFCSMEQNHIEGLMRNIGVKLF